MAETRLPYDPVIDAAQGRAVKFSTQGEFDRAEGTLTQAIESIRSLEGKQAALESLTNQTHLARLHRDLGLNSLRFAGVTWEDKSVRNSAIESAARQLGEASDDHRLARVAANTLENGRFIPHAKAEEGATMTAEARLLGLQLLVAREAVDGPMASQLEKAMLNKFTWAEAHYSVGDNPYYKVNGALIEALYLKALLGMPASEKVRYAMQVAATTEGRVRLKCGASLARRTLEVAFHAKQETILKHV